MAEQRWPSARAWLIEKASIWRPGQLYEEFVALLQHLDNDFILSLYHDEMDADGFFEPVSRRETGKRYVIRQLSDFGVAKITRGEPITDDDLEVVAEADTLVAAINLCRLVDPVRYFDPPIKDTRPGENTRWGIPLDA